jgi:tetratricopeptide (TPR) repeat protein
LALVLSGCASAYRSGQIAMQEGRYLEAASRFTEVLARDPNRADALFNLGLAQYRTGLFRAAIGPFGRAVLAAPDSAEARLYLALTYLALEDQGMAARQLRALLDLGAHPRIVVQAGRAVSLMESGPLPAELTRVHPPESRGRDPVAAGRAGSAARAAHVLRAGLVRG